MEIGRFAFLRLPLGDVGTTYDDHLRLIGKRVVDFLLALIELFSLGVTAESLRAKRYKKIGYLATTRSLLSEISGRMDRPPPIIFARLVALQLCR